MREVDARGAIIDLGNGSAAVISQFNDAPLATLRQGKVESISYRGARDAPVQMWVIYPPDFDPSKKYPVFMLLHGAGDVWLNVFYLTAAVTPVLTLAFKARNT